MIILKASITHRSDIPDRCYLEVDGETSWFKIGINKPHILPINIKG